MMLRSRISLAISIPFICLACALMWIADRHIMSQFESIEVGRMQDNVGRVTRAIDATTKAMTAKTLDWAQWDDTYDFMETRSIKYQESVLIFDTLSALGMRHVVYVTPERNKFFSYKVHPEKGVVEEIPATELAQLLALPSLFDARPVEEAREGIAQIGDEIVLLTSMAILDSARSKPPRGFLLFSKVVDESFIHELAQQTRLSVKMIPLNRVDRSEEDARAITKALGSPGNTFTAPKNEKVIEGFAILSSLAGQPLLGLRIEQGRDIFEQGIAARNFLAIALFSSVVVALLSSLVFVNWGVLKRIQYLAVRVQELKSSGALTGRVGPLGADEIGQLRNHINDLLEYIERSTDAVQTARAEAESANIAKSTFIAKVSHELRTPIHGVVGMLRILMKEETSKSKRSYIAMAKNSAFGLLETINEILDFSKIESGNLSLERIQFSLRDVVRDALRTVAPRAEEKETLELVCDVGVGVPDTFIGDPLRLKQCLINLLGNSIKFTKQGHVQLTIRSHGRVVAEGLVNEGNYPHHLLTLSVSDTGVGIPAERLPLIFDPFTQADDSVARVFTGTGLGLTIVKQLVEQMNGKVSVTSELGKGTEFTISVPLPEVTEVPWVDASHSFVPATIAIVDGASQSVQVMNQSAEQYGLQSIVVPSNDPESVAALMNHISRFGLVIVTSEAIKRSHVFNFVVEVAANKKTKLAVILSPFEISVRERLSALNVPYVMMRPVSLEDVLLAVEGRLNLDEESWEGEDEVKLVATRKLRVLIADDAETNRVILTNMLQEAGHDVVSVDNGLDMLSALKTQITGGGGSKPFDIVLTDIQMPMMDGLTATREIRALEKSAGRGGRIPMIAVTAHAMSEETQRMRECGVDDVVTKPIHPADLARALTELTGGELVQSNSTTEPISDPSLDEGPPSSPELESLKEMAFRLWLQLQAAGDVRDYEREDEEPPFGSILDVADVYERSGDSLRRSNLIFKAFLSSFKDPLAQLHTAKGAHEIDKLQHASHALKGLLLDIGAKTSAKLASYIETCCKQQMRSEAEQRVEMLGKQTLIIARLLEKMLETASSAQAPRKEATVITKEIEIPSVTVPAHSTAESVQFVAHADKLVKDTVVSLTDRDLKNLVPTRILETGVHHPTVELVYQLLDVHGVVAREGHNTTRSLLVFGAFLHAHEELLRELEASRQQRDMAKLKAVSQTLRNVLTDTGCPLGADVAHQVEQLCDLGEVDEAIKMCDSLKNQTRLVGKMLRQIVEQCAHA